MTEIIFKNKQGRIVGKQIDKTYYSERKPEHFMRMFGGFGISQSILDTLVANACVKIVIKYFGAKKVYNYSCPLWDFINSVDTYVFEGNDLQRFVNVESMEEMP